MLNLTAPSNSKSISQANVIRSTRRCRMSAPRMKRILPNSTRILSTFPGRKTRRRDVLRTKLCLSANKLRLVPCSPKIPKSILIFQSLTLGSKIWKDSAMLLIVRSSKFCQKSAKLTKRTWKWSTNFRVEALQKPTKSVFSSKLSASRSPDSSSPSNSKTSRPRACSSSLRLRKVSPESSSMPKSNSNRTWKS
jgi:hypothetical protein